MSSPNFSMCPLVLVFWNLVNNSSLFTSSIPFMILHNWRAPLNITVHGRCANEGCPDTAMFCLACFCCSKYLLSPQPFADLHLLPLPLVPHPLHQVATWCTTACTTSSAASTTWPVGAATVAFNMWIGPVVLQTVFHRNTVRDPYRRLGFEEIWCCHMYWWQWCTGCCWA